MNNVDIHKLIDETIEKKDRYVSLLVSKDSVHITVYPLGEDDGKWIVLDNGDNKYRYKHRFVCSACNTTSNQVSPYCPFCGEKLKTPSLE